MSRTILLLFVTYGIFFDPGRDEFLLVRIRMSRSSSLPFRHTDAGSGDSRSLRLP